MCGICGIVDFSERPIDRDALVRMRDMMVPRGPDDAGAEILPHVGLAHRRLSIIDLSPRGRQPMTNEDGSLWLVFNGEIYNFAELRRQLEPAGHRFASETDSEVLLHGFEQWGLQGLVERLNGMFAFALWDANERTLWLARDRLGKKPLYWGDFRGRFLFGSDIKALWSWDPGAFRVNESSVARYLYWMYQPGRETSFEDVFELLPGHFLRVTPDSTRETRYWSLSFADKTVLSLDDLVEGTEAVLAAAVRRRLRSDVPLGAFLSGGVDSSYVVSWMSDGAEQPVRTFSIGTDDPEHDETTHARRVADRWNTRHTEFQVSADAWGLLPRLVWAFGQLFGDAAAIPTYYVAKCAREHVTVALTGDGGDESFAGYGHHQGAYLAAGLGSAAPVQLVDALMRKSRGLVDSGARTPIASAARFLRFLHADPLIRRGSVNGWGLHHLDRLFGREHRELAARDGLQAFADEVAGRFDGRPGLDLALFEDLHLLLPFCYNVKLDVATMMSSLEARSPFQDYEVVEWAARIVPRQKLRPWEKKWLLKRLAARRIPRDVIYRPKHGFSLPMDSWFRGSWADPAHDLILGPTARARGWFDYEYLEALWNEHQRGQARHGNRFWLLLWLELWQRMFVDRTLSPEDSLSGGTSTSIAGSTTAPALQT